MKHNLLIVFLNISGLVWIDRQHHVQIVHDSWTDVYMQYNLADYYEVSKAKLKLVDNKQFIHWFLKKEKIANMNQCISSKQRVQNERFLQTIYKTKSILQKIYR